MFYHYHPYEPFIPENATKLIVGTLPPPRFCTGELKPDDVTFCYGSRDGLLWPILNEIFDLNLVYETTDFAINQRKQFLINRGIGVCDIVGSCNREKVDASDLGMADIKLRNLMGYLKHFQKVDTLLFTGGNSKNGPEYFFRKLIKDTNLKLVVKADEVPRIHQFELEGRMIKTVSLTSPSGSANRAIGSLPLYKEKKAKDPNYTTFDFRVEQYQRYF